MVKGKSIFQPLLEVKDKDRKHCLCPNKKLGLSENVIWRVSAFPLPYSKENFPFSERKMIWEWDKKNQGVKGA